MVSGKATAVFYINKSLIFEKQKARNIVAGFSELEV